MRLNDKSLIEFAASKDAIDKEGYLYKKGEVNRGFQKRWFVLKGNLLFYFEKRSDKQPAGVIVLEDCNVEVCATAERHSFSITFAAGASPRTYILSSDVESGMEEWMKAVTFAPYDYTRTVVRELQKRVNKLRSSDVPSPDKQVTAGTENDSDNLDGSNQEDLLDFQVSHYEEKRTSNDSPRVKRIDKPDKRASNYPDKTDGTGLRVPDSTNKAIKTLQGLVRRTKSSENLHQIHPVSDKQMSRSPIFKRKGREYQSMKVNVVGSKGSIEKNLVDAIYSDYGSTTLSAFQQLHESFGADVWTKVKAYEDSRGGVVQHLLSS